MIVHTGLSRLLIIQDTECGHDEYFERGMGMGYAVDLYDNVQVTECVTKGNENN